MTTTNIAAFDKSMQKTNEILHNIEVELGWENHRHQTYQVFRAVLHALRDRMTVADAANFSAQLPLLLKGVFFEGWKPESVPIKMDATEFLERVRCEIFLDLSISVKDLVQIVFNQISYSVDPLEQTKLIKALPDDFADFFEKPSIE